MLKRKPKQKINTSHISFGFLLLLFGCWGTYEAAQDDVDIASLQTSFITTQSISKLYGRSKSSEYLIRANETPVVFEIDVPGAIAAIRSNLDEIKTGDSLTIQTYFYLPENDNDPQEQATIFALEHNGVLLFDINGYNKAQDAYSFRLNTLWLIGALLFLLRGFDILKSKTSWIMSIAIAIALFVLRLLEIW